MTHCGTGCSCRTQPPTWFVFLNKCFSRHGVTSSAFYPTNSYKPRITTFAISIVVTVIINFEKSWTCRNSRFRRLVRSRCRNALTRWIVARWRLFFNAIKGLRSIRHCARMVWRTKSFSRRSYWIAWWDLFLNEKPWWRLHARYNIWEEHGVCNLWSWWHFKEKKKKN